MTYIDKLPIEDVWAFDEGARALYGDRECRIYSRLHGAWWRRSGGGYTPLEKDAWVMDLDIALSAIGQVGPEAGIELHFIIDNPDPAPDAGISPSMAYPMPPQVRHDSHNQGTSPRKDGSAVSQYVAVVPVTDLLSGSDSTEHIVLEFARVRDGETTARQQILWHGPFPTEPAARDFVSLLAGRAPTQAGAPT